VLVPEQLYGGMEEAMAALERLRPTHLQMPDSGGLGIGWYASAVLLSGIGAWAWPHIFAAFYSARSERVIRRNSGILPLYGLATLPIVLVGLACAAKAAEDPEFAAAISHPDHAMLVALVRYLPAWVAGAIGAGGLAAAISTASALILAASNLTARNVLQRGIVPRLDDRQTAWIARLLVAPVAVVAAGLALAAPDMLVSLLLVGYSGIAQFVPALFVGVFSRRPTLAGVCAGLVVGLGIAVGAQLAGWQPPWGLHPGFVGLVLNLVVMLLVSAFTRPPEAARLARFEELLAPEPLTGEKPLASVT